MTIVGICLALVAPRFAGLRDKAAVRGASGEISATFSLARQTAIARRAMVAIVLDTASGSVRFAHRASSYVNARSAPSMVLGWAPTGIPWCMMREDWAMVHST